MKALEIKQLKKTYDNGVEALKGIDLSVEESDFFALLGANGAGKSTTIGIITSLVNRSSGDIKIFGYDLARQPQEAKACIGLVPQEFNFNIFEKTRDILIIQAGYYGIRTAIAKERADHFLDKLGLWEKRNTTVRELSGGMKRRLMIARALMHHPKLLILDEPTAGVDIEIRRSMWDFLTEINQQGTTIILTTHYLEEAEQLCRNIAIIGKGEILENTSMKTLLSEMHHQTYVLDLIDALESAPNIDAFETTLVDPHTLEIRMDKHLSVNSIFEQLSTHNIEVHSLRNKSNRLEELFLDLINHE